MQNSLATQTATGKTEGFSSLLASLIIFFSATQLGLHFWPLSSLIYGIRIDYLSPTIYFLDILIILYLGLKRSDLVGHPTRSDLAGVILPILLLNLLYSQNPLATLSWSIHFLLYLLLLRSVLKRNSWLQAKKGSAAAERTVLYGILRSVLPISLLFQLLLALSQVSLGHSLGGLMYYLGERSVAVGSPGIALGTFMDSVVLRAYGTFSHPNILAGWSVVSLLIILFMTRGRSPSKLPFLTTILTTFVVLLTQSRSAALSLFGLIIPFYLIKNLKLRTLYLIALPLFIIHYSLFTPPRSDLSFTERLDLQGVSLKVIRQLPLFGAGAQASISIYPNISPTHRLLQPDHNSLTLFLSWFGFFGVLAVLYSLGPLHLPSTIYHLLPLAPLLALDHYLLTSPQGLFILLLYFFTIRRSGSPNH